MSYRPLAELSLQRVDAQAAATQRIAINPKNNQCVCGLYEEEEVRLCNARGGIDENSLRAFTLSMKGTPLLLGRGAARAADAQTYKVAQIWWSRRSRRHS